MLQRIEGLWPLHLCTHWEAFILSSGASPGGPTLPTSYRASDAGNAGSPRGGFGGMTARLPAWLSGGWARVLSSDPDQPQGAAQHHHGSFSGHGNLAGVVGSEETCQACCMTAHHCDFAQL